MCGIAGLFVQDIVSNADLLLNRMVKSLNHRGPDGEGQVTYSIPSGILGLCHTRLSIIDLNTASNQPFHSTCGKYTIVFNGEIYNYIEVKQELLKLGIIFRTASDTEVLLNAIIQWGEGAYAKLRGMWAFALFDHAKSLLLLSRDRLGKKPLYYHISDGELFFASEIKAILAVTQKKYKLNKRLVYDYLAQQLLNHSDETFFEGIFSLKPATYCHINLKQNLEMKQKSYWELKYNPIEINVEDASQEFHRLFSRSIKDRLVADVKIGVLLSGGLDSSAIVAKVLETSKANEISFLSAISQSPQFSEDYFIKKIEDKFDITSQKISLDLTPDELLSLIRKTTWHNDQPLGNLSNIAHYKLMQLARKLGLFVALTGQGADEGLCGYKKFVIFYLKELARKGKIGSAAKTFFEFLFNGTILKQLSIDEAKRYTPSLFQWSKNVLGTSLQQFKPNQLGSAGLQLAERQILDVTNYSVPTLLHYEDRMSMASGVEVRCPYLDHNLLEFMINLPSSLKIKDGWTKWLLRHSLSSALPQETTWRRDKQGFLNPQAQWLKQALKPEINRLLASEMLSSTAGLIDQKAYSELYLEYLKQPSFSGFKYILHPMCLEIWLDTNKTHINEL